MKSIKYLLLIFYYLMKRIRSKCMKYVLYKFNSILLINHKGKKNYLNLLIDIIQWYWCLSTISDLFIIQFIFHTFRVLPYHKTSDVWIYGTSNTIRDVLSIRSVFHTLYYFGSEEFPSIYQYFSVSIFFFILATPSEFTKL